MQLRAAPLCRRVVASLLVVAHLLLIGPVTSSRAAAAERVVFYHDDALGSPVAMTDASGSVVWRADYEPFGGVAAETGTVGNTHQFTGKERDAETGLQYFGARFYDAGIGRFLSVDPALLRGRPDSALENPLHLTLYAYAANNPYRFIDSDGRFLAPLIPVLIAIGGSITSVLLNPSTANAPVPGTPLVNSQTDLQFARAVAIDQAIGFGIGKAATKIGGVFLGRWLSKGATNLASEEAGVIATTAETVGQRSFSSFSAFKRFLGSSGPGRAWRHIVEQSQTSRFGQEAIQHTNNVVALPAELRIRVSALYSSIRESITGSTTLTVREWLSTQSYEAARDFGMRAIQKVSEGSW